jgi:hypothetical protein
MGGTCVHQRTMQEDLPHAEPPAPRVSRVPAGSRGPASPRALYCRAGTRRRWGTLQGTTNSARQHCTAKTGLKGRCCLHSPPLLGVVGLGAGLGTGLGAGLGAGTCAGRQTTTAQLRLQYNPRLKERVNAARSATHSLHIKIWSCKGRTRGEGHFSAAHACCCARDM